MSVPESNHKPPYKPEGLRTLAELTVYEREILTPLTNGEIVRVLYVKYQVDKGTRTEYPNIIHPKQK